MRPTTDPERTDAYECLGCGARIDGARTRGCEQCGDELVSLGVERDW